MARWKMALVFVAGLSVGLLAWLIVETGETTMFPPKGGAALSDFPTPEMQLTHIVVVSDLERSRQWYQEVLGARLYREYDGTSAVFDFNGAWLLLVTGGGPTADKPDVSFAAPEDANTVSHSFTIRVPDCEQAYETLKSRGADFLTPPFDWGGEVRCFFRDPDGHLFEISEAR